MGRIRVLAVAVVLAVTGVVTCPCIAQAAEVGTVFNRNGTHYKVTGADTLQVGDGGACAFSSPGTSIIIPETLVYDGVEYSVTRVGAWAFADLESLTQVALPGTITSIGMNAFRNCEALITIDVPDACESIEERAFYNCSQLSSVGLGSSLKSIGDLAFYNCRSLGSMEFGDSVATIGNSAFYYCDSLASVSIPPSVTVIGDWAFGRCPSLVSVAVPDTVTSIGYRAFTTVQLSSFADVQPVYIYEGMPVTPEVQVMLATGPLPYPSQYTVTYADNDGPGTGTVTIRGKGEFDGVISRTFRVVNPSNVRGRVTDAYSTTPVSDAYISITGGHGPVMTAYDGSFELQGLPAGAYTVAVQKPGFVTRQQTVVVSLGRDTTANIVLVRNVGKASVARAPSKSKLTYKRKSGVAKFKLAATMKGWGSKALSGRTVYLQTSKDGKKWKSTYKLKTGSTGKVSKSFKIRSKQVRYYRWYVPGKSQVNLKTYSVKTKVTVK